MTPKEAFQDAWKKIKQVRAIYRKASASEGRSETQVVKDVRRVFDKRAGGENGDI